MVALEGLDMLELFTQWMLVLRWKGFHTCVAFIARRWHICPCSLYSDGRAQTYSRFQHETDPGLGSRRSIRSIQWCDWQHWRLDSQNTFYFLLAVSPLLTRGAVLFTRYYVYQTQNHVSSWSYIPPVQLWNSFNMYRIRNTELVDFSLELWIMDDVSRAITKVATLWGERRGAVLWIQHLWSSHCGWYFCFGSAFQI